MRIAVTYENGNVFQDFDTTQQFKLYLVEDGEIFNEMVVDASGDLLSALAARKVDTLICGSVSADKKSALEQIGIVVHEGAEGSADNAARAVLAGAI